MVKYALAGGVQQSQVIHDGCGRIVWPIAPRLAAAVAKPEDAGLHIRRIVDRAGNGLQFASYNGHALNNAIIADRPAKEASCNARIRSNAATAHSIAEVGAFRDPPVDGPRRYVEKFRQLVVSSAEQAVVVCLFAHVGGEIRGSAHEPVYNCSSNELQEKYNCRLVDWPGSFGAPGGARC